MQGTGIYQISNNINGKRYIGSAVNLRRRKNDHVTRLNCKTHDNAHLQRAWGVYGSAAFSFHVVEYVHDTGNLVKREQHYLDTLKPEYNVCPTAGSCLGRRFSETVKKKMSETKKGKVFSEEHKQKLREAAVGKTLSREHKEKIGAAGVGRVVTDITRAKISKAHTGKKLTSTHKEKLSSAKLGIPRSEEVRQKMSEARRGENNNGAKLKECQVVEIRQMISNGVFLKDIAEIYGINRETISLIKRGKTWKNLGLLEVV